MKPSSDRIRKMPKTELHQHVDGSIPPSTIWRMMRRHRLTPVRDPRALQKLLTIQPGEEGTLLAYLDKFHYPLWITQFYENIQEVTEAIARDAAKNGVKTLELRYSPVIHTYAGLTLRQAIRSVLTGLNRASKRHGIDCGLIVIAMRQHGPHIAKILARQAISEAQHLHDRAGVVGFDIAGPERTTPPRLFREAYEVAAKGGLGVTAHSGEEVGPEVVWQTIDDLGVSRIGHACSAVRDPVLMRRLARDGILVECCLTSNYQTGAVAREAKHPIVDFVEKGVPVAICTDNTTVSGTDQNKETALLRSYFSLKDIARIHAQAREYSYILKRPRPSAR
ncbi:MAG: adenosine deaminase [Acidobacteria bacterium]|nr:adenosine deaminase [Acidobacteriota bacterium]